MMEKKLEKNLKYATETVRKNPFDIEANYNYAVCSEEAGYYDDAYDYYLRVVFLQEQYKKNLISLQKLSQRVEALQKLAETDEELKVQMQDKDDARLYATHDPFKDYNFPIIGKMLIDSSHCCYYVGRCESWFEAYYAPERNRDAFTAKCELFPIAEYTNHFEIMVKDPVLLPVVLKPNEGDKEKNYIIDAESGEEKIYLNGASCKYSYIPVTGKANFYTGKPAVFGQPIPLKMKRDKAHKRLVLNLFIDSFNERVIKEHGLENIMPNTAEFFSKGIICEQYYSCSEFTQPSIATYWTGKYPTNHMSLDERFRCWFMDDEKKNFAEYFKDAGYVTAKIGGNWSITPAQGYIRGMDRYVYQYASEGLSVKDVISDAIEHIDTFKEDNQFLWLDFLDLHEVAGGFMRSISVQSKVSFQARVTDNEMRSTVQQSHSNNKKQIYLQELSKMDLYLGMLYAYIEKNYSDNEIVVSLFSDHGTAFMVEDDQPFLSYQRTNVPLMIRTDKVPRIVCNEIIQTTDYAGILCKLAGVDYNYSGTDANLPIVFGGRTEREFALAQSVFVGDPYQAGIHGKNFHCYVRSEKPVKNGFRIDMNGFRIWAVDDENRDITEVTDISKYKDIVMNQITHLLTD